MSCGLLAPLHEAKKLRRLPFFQRYGVNLPSSLTEGHSFTWGEFPLPTSVGVRYGQSPVWVEAFLGGIGVDDFRILADTRDRRQASVSGICRAHALRSASPACPVAGFTSLTASPLPSVTTDSGAGLSHLLSIAYDDDVLGLGPD